jgi:hypothetical protein
MSCRSPRNVIVVNRVRARFAAHGENQPIGREYRSVDYGGTAHFATTWLCVSLSTSLRPVEPQNSGISRVRVRDDRVGGLRSHGADVKGPLPPACGYLDRCLLRSLMITRRPTRIRQFGGQEPPARTDVDACCEG